MHRIPLLIPTPSNSWNRNLSECLLFERTLNIPNVEETTSFFQILESQADFCKRISNALGPKMFAEAVTFFDMGTPNSREMGMCLINSVILRTPKDSPVFPSALAIRGNFHYEQNLMEYASRDYEMYLEVYKGAYHLFEEVCEVFGRLGICMHMLRKFTKAKKYLQLYNKNKAKLSKDALTVPPFRLIENYIRDFKIDVDVGRIDKVMPEFVENQCKRIPYKGFSSGAEIPAASSMCLHHENEIYAAEEIPKGSILFVEDPVFQSLNIPFIDCEVCHKQAQHTNYTCFECRYKTYCSLHCMEKDKSSHSHECVGYKQLTLIILDAISIFRLFVKISQLLHERIFKPHSFRLLKTAQQVWNKMFEVLSHSQLVGVNDFALLKMIPNYGRLSSIQYSTLVATAFRLTLFIEMKTNLIEKNYNKLSLSNKQKLILIGSILMRLHCNILLNTFDFEITRTSKYNDKQTIPHAYSNTEEIAEVMAKIKPQSCVIENINEFYNIKNEYLQELSQQVYTSHDNIENVKSELTVLRHVESCKRIHRMLSTFKDKIAKICFNFELLHILYGKDASEPTSNDFEKELCKRIAEMPHSERLTFIERHALYFHIFYADYFLQMFDYNEGVTQVLSLSCPTLTKFKHSCEPNVEVIILDDGVVIGKSLRTLQKDEPLYVAYKAHYSNHCKEERQKFLELFEINCKCNYCNMSDLVNPTDERLGVFCENCIKQILPSQSACTSCNIQYNDLINKYRSVLFCLEKELQMELRSAESTEKYIYALHLLLYTFSKIYFIPQNETRTLAELRFAYFLALQNFAKQSYQITTCLYIQFLQFYDKNLVWFTFFDDILSIVKIILWNNLENKLLILSNSELHHLCSIGLEIATGQKAYIEFYEMFDRHCSKILDDIFLLLKWKEKIECKEVLLPSSFTTSMR